MVEGGLLEPRQMTQMGAQAFDLVAIFRTTGERLEAARVGRMVERGER